VYEKISEVDEIYEKIQDKHKHHYTPEQLQALAHLVLISVDASEHQVALRVIVLLVLQIARSVLQLPCLQAVR